MANVKIAYHTLEHPIMVKNAYLINALKCKNYCRMVHANIVDHILEHKEMVGLVSLTNVMKGKNYYRMVLVKTVQNIQGLLLKIGHNVSHLNAINYKN